MDVGVCGVACVACMRALFRVSVYLFEGMRICVCVCLCVCACACVSDVAVCAPTRARMRTWARQYLCVHAFLCACVCLYARACARIRVGAHPALVKHACLLGPGATLPKNMVNRQAFCVVSLSVADHKQRVKTSAKAPEATAGLPMPHYTRHRAHHPRRQQILLENLECL